MEWLNNFKKSVVFLGRINEKGEYEIKATGFLINIRNITHLITAKHVIMDVKSSICNDEDMIVLFNKKNEGIGTRSIESMKQNFGLDWITHKDKELDISIIPFWAEKNDDVLSIPGDSFLDVDSSFELYDIFFFSYQPGIEPQKRTTPIIRSGTISLFNEDNTFYIDAPAFPGNSGSPVFIKPSPIRFNEAGISIGGDSFGGKFIGLIAGYLTYADRAVSVQTGHLRLVSEENTGLSKVLPTKFIKEIIELDAFKRQLEKISEK